MNLASLEKRVWRALELHRRGRIGRRTKQRLLKDLMAVAPERCRQLTGRKR